MPCIVPDMPNHTDPNRYAVEAEACEHMHTSTDANGVETCDTCETVVAQRCIVDFDRDGITLWDCPCAECRALRAHAAWMDAG